MRSIADSFDSSFDEISRTSRELLARTAAPELFRDLREGESSSMCSIGEYLVRSAAVVEQAFGGLTRRLWDDPFEWTLPEELSEASRILVYFDEVDATRRSGMSYIGSDGDLAKHVPAPVRLKSIAAVLIEAIGSARHYQGRAFALYQITSIEKLPLI